MNNNFEDMPITNLSVRDSVCMVSVAFEEDDGNSTITHIFDTLKSKSINLEMVSQVSVEDATLLTFAVPSADVDDILDSLSVSLNLEDVSIYAERDLCKIILVGIGFLTHKDLVHSIFETLTENDINFSHISMSEISVSFTISPSLKDKAISVLAERFEL